MTFPNLDANFLTVVSSHLPHLVVNYQAQSASSGDLRAIVMHFKYPVYPLPRFQRVRRRCCRNPWGQGEPIDSDSF